MKSEYVVEVDQKGFDEKSGELELRERDASNRKNCAFMWLQIRIKDIKEGGLIDKACMDLISEIDKLDEELNHIDADCELLWIEHNPKAAAEETVAVRVGGCWLETEDEDERFGNL